MPLVVLQVFLSTFKKTRRRWKFNGPTTCHVYVLSSAAWSGGRAGGRAVGRSVEPMCHLDNEWSRRCLFPVAGPFMDHVTRSFVSFSIRRRRKRKKRNVALKLSPRKSSPHLNRSHTQSRLYALSLSHTLLILSFSCSRHALPC